MAFSRYLLIVFLLSLTNPAFAGADGDGVADESDNCISTPNPLQLDLDQDGIGSVCDDDEGIFSLFMESIVPFVQGYCDEKSGTECDRFETGKCVRCHVENGLAGSTNLIFKTPPEEIEPDPVTSEYNLSQLISFINSGGGDLLISKSLGENHGGGVQLVSDSEEITKLEELVELLLDSDSDGLEDDTDNCPNVANADQLDTDSDGLGNECDTDDDGDSIPDSEEPYDDEYSLTHILNTDWTGDGVVNAMSDTFIWNRGNFGFASTSLTMNINLEEKNNWNEQTIENELDQASVAFDHLYPDVELFKYPMIRMLGHPAVCIGQSGGLVSYDQECDNGFSSKVDLAGLVLRSEVRTRLETDPDPNGMIKIESKPGRDAKSEITLSYTIQELSGSHMGSSNADFYGGSHKLFYDSSAITLIEPQAASEDFGEYLLSSMTEDSYDEDNDPSTDFVMVISLCCTWNTNLFDGIEEGVVRLGYTMHEGVSATNITNLMVALPDNFSYEVSNLALTNLDSDYDGIVDTVDAFPLDPSESIDTDNDAVGDNSDNCSVTVNEDQINTDGDTEGDACDADDDNDGVLDADDAFPLDSTESVDTDADGTGNNADTDDDNDGVADTSDDLPLDATESVDTDSDGIGNNTDNDDDGDGVADTSDVFPLDADESVDTDDDGTGNNADTDDDGDGVNDELDAFPLDSAESVDTDSDAIGNNADTDDDGDGVVDESDAYPLISLGGLTDTDGDGKPNDCDSACSATDMGADNDDDGDGVSDSSDAFPLDYRESVDTDGDGYGNNLDTDDDGDEVPDFFDAFPLDADESVDTDDDGVGDNADVFPEDPSEFADSDSDSVGDNSDNCPILVNVDQINTDGDTEGDACDTDDDNDGYSDEQEAIDGTDPLNPFSCSQGCFSFDIDLDEKLEADALTDGLLVIRHLFGFSGDALIAGAISNDATRQNATEITSYLNDAESELDIDGDGEAGALTDGLILIRYLFGFSGDALISGAVSEDAERTTAEQIEAYISERIPAI